MTTKRTPKKASPKKATRKATRKAAKAKVINVTIDGILLSKEDALKHLRKRGLELVAASQRMAIIRWSELDRLYSAKTRWEDGLVEFSALFFPWRAESRDA